MWYHWSAIGQGCRLCSAVIPGWWVLRLHSLNGWCHWLDSMYRQGQGLCFMVRQVLTLCSAISQSIRLCSWVGLQAELPSQVSHWLCSSVGHWALLFKDQAVLLGGTSSCTPQLGEVGDLCSADGLCHWLGFPVEWSLRLCSTIGQGHSWVPCLGKTASCVQQSGRTIGGQCCWLRLQVELCGWVTL